MKEKQTKSDLMNSELLHWVVTDRTLLVRHRKKQGVKLHTVI